MNKKIKSTNKLSIPNPKLAQNFYENHYLKYKENLQNFIKKHLQKFFKSKIQTNNRKLNNLLNTYTAATFNFSINPGKYIRPYFSYITLYQVIKHFKKELAKTPSIPNEKLYSTNLALTIGTYLELIHNHLLIHDDIMDKSIKRRQQPTTWFNLYTKLKNKHMANSLAILSGNATLFGAFNLLKDLKSINKTGIQNAIDITTTIINKVIYGQALDIGIEKSKIQNIDIDDILTIYKNKTAIYTNIFPVILVSKLFNAKDIFNNTHKFYTILLDLGIIFQTIDDIKDLANTQKTKYLDIVDKKRTILVYFALTNTKPKTKNKLIKYYNNSKTNITPQTIAKIIKIYGIPQAQKYISHIWNKILQSYKELNPAEQFVIYNQMYVLNTYYEKMINNL